MGNNLLNLDTSIIICTYTEDRWGDIVEAVESLQKQTHKPDEIILVADHNPKLAARMKERFPDAVVVENKEKQGLSGARNSGIAAARGKLIGFLDDDAVADSQWLERLVKLCENPQIMGTGGRVDPYWLGERPDWFPEEFYWVIGCSYKGMPEQIQSMRNLFGGCMVIRRDIFEQVGGFHTDIGRIGTIPLGCEETELCIRANQRNPDKSFVYDPGAKIYHKIPTKRTNWKYFRSRCYAEGLSKAMVAQLVGANSGLSAETNYTLKTLPAGVLRGLWDSIKGINLSGVSRASAIVLGFTTTVIGYLWGRIQLQRNAARQSGPALEKVV